jgi:hypothetical protein
MDLNRSLMRKIHPCLIAFSMLALPAFGQSTLSPEYGYSVSTWLPEFPNVGAFDFSDTLFFLHDGDTIHMLSVNTGEELNTFGEPWDYADSFVSFLTISPDGTTIWTGYTNYGSADDRIYSIDVESGEWKQRATFPGNWDLVFWRDSILVSGLNSSSWDAPSAIFLLDTTGNNVHRKIIEAGGYSAGVAIDSQENLYYGTSYPMDPNALYRWHVDTLRKIIEDPLEPVLLITDAEKLTDLPAGVYDCEVDEGDHVLFNMNLDGGIQALCKWNGVSGDGQHIDTLATAAGEWDWLGNLKSRGDITLTAPGNMVVTYSFGQPLSAITHVSTVGLSETHVPDFSVYPNPSRGIMNILSGQEDIMEIRVYTLQGTLVHRVSSLNPGAEIDISNLEPGSYILRLRDGRGSFSKMIQKL